jgi:transcriptional regulator with XRE-family HTH domain
LKSAIAGNVKRIITDKGFKQSSIAKIAGYDPKVFNNMLNGRKLISDYDIPPIAKALGVSPNDLFHA